MHAKSWIMATHRVFCDIAFRVLPVHCWVLSHSVCAPEYLSVKDMTQTMSDWDPKECWFLATHDAFGSSNVTVQNNTSRFPFSCRHFNAMAEAAVSVYWRNNSIALKKTCHPIEHADRCMLVRGGEINEQSAVRLANFYTCGWVAWTFLTHRVSWSVNVRASVRRRCRWLEWRGLVEHRRIVGWGWRRRWRWRRRLWSENWSARAAASATKVLRYIQRVMSYVIKYDSTYL